MEMKITLDFMPKKPEINTGHMSHWPCKMALPTLPYGTAVGVKNI